MSGQGQAAAGQPQPQPQPGPLPRMTDHITGSGAPSSLKFASLSVQSYALDSPPFTGAAIGGSVSSLNGSTSYDQQHAGSPPAGSAQSPSKRAPGESSSTANNDTASRASLDGGLTPNTHSSHRDANPFDQIGPESANGAGADGTIRKSHLPRDQDIPSWRLDSDASRHQRRPSYPSRSGNSMSRDRIGAEERGSGSSSSPRPAYSTLVDDLDGVEDATSVATDREADEEVDGDGTAFVLRRSGSTSTHKVPVQPQHRDHYRFPKHRLPLKMRDESKIPLIIVACGSFSPPTYLHLRIFEMAKDSIVESGKYELLAGYYSPVSDYYKKEGLAKATHRVRMCELAVEKTSTWLMVDAWESLQDEYQRTAVVLDHFHEEVNKGPNGGIKLADGSKKEVKIMLLAGGDLIQSMGEPGVWAEPDLHHILGNYGCLIVERTGADVWSFLLGHDLLWRYRRNLKIVKQTIYNDISSSKVRLFVRRGLSIKYLLPNSVINYIEEQRLYRLPEEEQIEVKETNW